MATIKVKLRPSSVEGRMGTIYYQVSHRGKVKNIRTKIKINPNMWDITNSEIRNSVSNKSLIQNRIDRDTASLKQIIHELSLDSKTYNVSDIITRYHSLNHSESVLGYMRYHIQLMYEANRIATAQNYEKTLKNFLEFLNEKDIRFCDITEELIAKYNIFLINRGLVRNSVSFYMRIMRALYNKAVRQKLVIQTHPFTEVYTGIDYTRKRAVPESIIIELYQLKLDTESSIALARDIFIFSYCTRGMAFIDIAFLKKTDIQFGSIQYIRRKTRRLLSIKIEACIQRIIDQYASNLSPYVFPIITSTEAKQAYKEYQIAINKYNRLLGQLSRMISKGYKLTSYTARHSWATAARDHKIPISIISAGMGHTSEQTTQIYLATLENSVIDNANYGLIKALLK